MENNDESIKSPEEDILTSNKPTIKHLVISGGGAYGNISYGALRESCKQGFWDLKNIKTIYATSIGAIFSNIIAISLDWDTMDNYIINRPWDQVFVFDMYSIMNSISNKGILNIKVIEDIFTPLLKAKDLSPNITLKEYYEANSIEIHLFATCLDDLSPVDISYKTHPDWKLTEAIYASCSLPILFSPLVKDGKTYFDGGVFCNYPVYECSLQVEDKNEILGVHTVVKREAVMQKNESIFDYLFIMIKLLIVKVNSFIKSDKHITIENEVIIEMNEVVSLYSIYLAVSDNKVRSDLINRGKQEWDKFWGNKNKLTNKDL